MTTDLPLNNATQEFTDEDCSDRLLVKGLPIHYTRDKLKQLFEPFGELRHVFISSSEKSSSKCNLGSVHFIQCKHAFLALNQFNQTSNDGNKLDISFAHPLHKESQCRIRSQIMANKQRDCHNYISNTTIHELDIQSLVNIFHFLSIKQMFAISRVCRLWKQVCNKLMENQTVLSFGTTNYSYRNGCLSHSHCVNDGNDMSDALIVSNKFSAKDLTQLAPIVRFTYNIECLQFANCFIDTIALKWIITQCPKLECLKFHNIEGIQELDWPKIGKSLSAKIVHFSYGGNKLNNWKSLSRMVNFFNILEDLTIFDCLQDLEKVFLNLSPTVTNLCVRDCRTLNLSAIKALIRRNGPNIKHFIIDLNGVDESEAIIDCIYDAFPDLQSFKALNITNSQIKSFTYENFANLMTIVFNEFIDFSLMAESVRKSVKCLQISGLIKPSSVKLICDMIPNCEEFKLSLCYFYCECHRNANQLLSDRYYSCFNCYEQSFGSIIRLPKLNFLDINGTQYQDID